MNLKDTIFLLFVQTYQKRKEVPYLEWSRDNDQKKMRIKVTNCSSEIFLQLSFTKNKSHFSTSSFLSRSPMAYNTTAFLDKLACTDYVDFGKCQDRFGRFSWSKYDSNYLDVKLKVFKRENKNAEFGLRQKFTMGEADFDQFIRQRNQLVVAADNILREQNLPPGLQSTLYKDMEEQLKLVHKVIDVVDRQNRKNCITLLLYKVDNPKTSMLKFVYSDGRRRTKNFSKMYMSTINLTTLYIFLTS